MISKKQQIYWLYLFNAILWLFLVVILNFSDILRPIYKTIKSEGILQSINAFNYTKYGTGEIKSLISGININENIEQEIYTDTELKIIYLNDLKSIKIGGEFVPNDKYIYVYNNKNTELYRKSIFIHELMHFIYDKRTFYRKNINMLVKDEIMKNKDALKNYIDWGVSDIDKEYSENELLNIKQDNDIISNSCILNSFTYNMHLYLSEDDTLLKDKFKSFIESIDTLNLEEENILFNETFAVCLQNYYINYFTKNEEELKMSLSKGKYNLSEISEINFEKTYKSGLSKELINIIFKL